MDLVRYMREAGVPIGPGTRVMEVRRQGCWCTWACPALIVDPARTHSTDSVSVPCHFERRRSSGVAMVCLASMPCSKVSEPPTSASVDHRYNIVCSYKLTVVRAGWLPLQVRM